MDDVLFQSLFYDQLSPIYGVYKENGKEVKIRLHASSFINQQLKQEVAMETFGLKGFIFGIAAFQQVTKMKKDVETLKETVENLSGESD